LLKDIIGNLHPFWGVTVLVGGDFRQTLRVVRGGSDKESLQASITTRTLCYNFHIYRLTANMRTEEGQHDIADCLLGVGGGTLNKDYMDVTINLQRLKAVTTIDSYITNVCGLYMSPSTNKNNNKGILSPHNEHSRRIIDIGLERMDDN
jgi:PIF1-like helicase